ncbi:MAG TPA: iron chelate uptake ABC transporter family permease subunit [Mycobacterium sp.]|nr:iron chelate uptake ABC transporter family permease subunit [Mycobacterium sp.]
MLAATCIVSLAVGTENVTLSSVWQAVTDYHDIGDEWIVHDLRIPRTLLALLVGLALGLSGTLIQAVGRNPLADAEILGINSRGGAFRGLRDRLPRHDRHLDLHLVRLRRRAVRMLLVYLIGMTGRATVTPVRVLLAGVAVGAVMDPSLQILSPSVIRRVNSASCAT